MTHGGDVWQGNGPEAWLDFSANLRPGGPPEWVREALLAGLDNAAYYPEVRMTRAGEALGEYLSLPPDCVLPTAGGISAIDLAIRLAKDRIVALSPCFGEYRERALAQGKGFVSFSVLERAEAALGPGDALFLCNPSNPTGAVFSRETIADLLRAAEAVGGFVVIDEAFVDYCPEFSCRPLLSAHPNLLIVGSMTKILGIPGVRLGYLCGAVDRVESLRKYQLTWEISCFAEAVLLALPAHRADIRRDAEINRVRRAALAEALSGLGARVYPSEGAFLLADWGRPAEPIARRLKTMGILTRLCGDFEGIDDGRHMRLAVKDESSNRRLLSALREALRCGENP